jgi:hypothetical protein
METFIGVRNALHIMAAAGFAFWFVVRLWEVMP